MKRVWQHPAEPTTGKHYWRSLGQLTGQESSRTWQDREFQDGAAVMKASEAPGIAEKREAYTRHAIEQGVFGAPSFVIDGEIFWGQDRLDFVERKLAS